MNGEVIKSFLVGLGFAVDEASLSKFNKAIASAGTRVLALYGSVKVAAAGIFWSISKISEGFEQMGYEYRIIAPAINKALVLRRELLKAYEAAGVNITKVIQQSVKFNMSLAKTQFALKAIYASVASKFFPLLTKQVDTFRKQIYANMPKIQAALEKFIRFVFKAFDATVILGQRIWSILSRVYDFFEKLHKSTDGWSTIILGVVAAWKLLNLQFLTTPLGMIIAGLVAVLALFDDFKTWEEGGESLFDWGKFVPVIDAVAEHIKIVRDVIQGLIEVVLNAGLAIYQLFKGDFSGFWDSVKNQVRLVTDLVMNLVKGIMNAGTVIGAVGEWVGSLFGDDPTVVQKNIQNNPAAGGARGARPLGTNVSNQQQTNLNVNQQTSINVSATADANGTARAIAGQQSRVNFDMVRNMRGATR